MMSKCKAAQVKIQKMLTEDEAVDNMGKWGRKGEHCVDTMEEWSYAQ